MFFQNVTKTNCVAGVAAIGFVVLMSWSASAIASSDEVKAFYIKTVHVDGVTSIHGDDAHKPEAFPSEKLPAGGGLVLTEPDASGKWKMRAFAFLPWQITVHEGDRVQLNFVGAQGAKHTIHVEGEGVDEKFQLTRGTLKAIEFTAGKAADVEIECYDHEPSMRAEVLILPKR